MDYKVFLEIMGVLLVLGGGVWFYLRRTREARQLARGIMQAKKDAVKKAGDDFVKSMKDKLGVVDKAKDDLMVKATMAEGGVKSIEKRIKDEMGKVEGRRAEDKKDEPKIVGPTGSAMEAKK